MTGRSSPVRHEIAGSQIACKLKQTPLTSRWRQGSSPFAEGLRDTLVSKVAVEPGAFADEPQGPHPVPQFNVIFEIPEFRNIVPWLMLNHKDFAALIHPLTESNRHDLTQYAPWLVTPVPLTLAWLSANLPEKLSPAA